MHSPQAPSDTPEVIQALLISAHSDDQVVLHDLFDRFNWHLQSVSTCREALTCLSGSDIAVVICEQDLHDGNWKLVLNKLNCLLAPPNLFVTSRLASDGLWSEVLNLGGYDVLAQPFDCREVHRVVFLAWHARKRRAEAQDAPKGRRERVRAKSRAQATALNLGQMQATAGKPNDPLCREAQPACRPFTPSPAMRTTTDRGPTQYACTCTVGSSFQPQMSCGGSSAVSIHRRQWFPAPVSAGSSKSRASQYAFSMTCTKTPSLFSCPPIAMLCEDRDQSG